MDPNDQLEHEKRLDEQRRYWDNAAASFDAEPDHGLKDPQVRQAWLELLRQWLPARMPAPGASVLDIGCGTGSLSVVIAELGNRVTGIDLSPAMIDKAKAKARALGYSIEFHVMDAAAVRFPAETFDVLVCRHVLWALPDPAAVLMGWVNLLKPGGRLILIEGYWHTGAGMHAAEAAAVLPASVNLVAIQTLNSRAAYWGSPVNDERYILIADRPAQSVPYL